MSTATIVIIVLVILAISQKGRILLGAAILIFLLAASWRALFHSYSCAAGGPPCKLIRQWSGVCSAGEGAALLRVDGYVYLTAEEGTASATCLNVLGVFE